MLFLFYYKLYYFRIEGSFFMLRNTGVKNNVDVAAVDNVYCLIIIKINSCLIHIPFKMYRLLFGSSVI